MDERVGHNSLQQIVGDESKGEEDDPTNNNSPSTETKDL